MQWLVKALMPSLLIGLAGCGTVPKSHSEAADETSTVASKGTANSAVSDAVYVVSGPEGFTSTGSVSVTNGAEAQVVLSGLTVGDNYVIDVSTPGDNGETQCSGSNSFDVADAGASVAVIVQLDCKAKGRLNLNATFNMCPVIDSLSAKPTSLALGGIATLAVAAHDTDNGPSPLAYSWAVNGVNATLQSTANLKFTCAAVGQFTIAATVSDGSPSASCMATSSVKVGCE